MAAATPRWRDRKAKKSPSKTSATRSSQAREPIEGQAASKLSPGLYIVSTPIGNAGDITLRALDVLRTVDMVICEDTRVTRKLLAIHGIQARLEVYNDHNAHRVRPKLLARLSDGAAIALVSDAGTPLISDPGHKLVVGAIAEGIPVTAVPGVTSAVAALTVSGLPANQVLFVGFLPSRRPARRRRLTELAISPVTLIVFESARRLPATLADMAEILGHREAAVARELTKLFEEVRRGDLTKLAAAFASDGAPKGEVVVIVGPPHESTAGDAQVDELLAAALREMPPSRAVAEVVAKTGVARSQVYARALVLKSVLLRSGQ